MKKIDSQKDNNIKKVKKKRSIFVTVNIIILVLVLIAAVTTIFMDPGNMSDGDYGAGDYYYTDLEGFEKIFYTMNLGTNHPIIFFSLFLGWGLICWRILKYFDKRF
ncbi:hypothetical protein SAMN00017405_1589 [Desulfonispora thiosulfatigenes DSM 11270]|uniref:Uncharacterized protein n=1 Tax=Desulfonispora thiosulfatigenes DSM 11270 TaxID=656914 RepID=A0A1W1UVG7_DESTI|nr:hypothetical protein [Desulfonispora thiosulfatigenes]SMB85026.1 hypothetical protein SAMN00017405_1589 [Desulfonispora thiosulfatigenes DSM 11270]